MEISRRVNAFLRLRDSIEKLDNEAMNELIQKANYYNPWFTEENIKLSLKGVINYLDEGKLKEWLANYNHKNSVSPKKVGVIMAGNIPLVGFHDFLCVLLSGHSVKVKLSSQDEKLLPFLSEKLCAIDNGLENAIEFAEKLQDIDAMIATGSNNTARYFNYYFRDIPHIIRKNRTSVAVLNGNENHEDLQKLGYDFFQYFGLGCRNVSKVYIPENYDITLLLDAIMDWQYLAEHHKYINNYNYNRAIYAMEKIPHLDTGFALFNENESLVSPTSVIYYEKYSDPEALQKQLQRHKDSIQCVVSNNCWYRDSIDFGTAQMPDIWDYSDNVDTMAFLQNI